MSEKTEKSSHKKKSEKVVEGRKYAVISSQSVITVAESCGISGLSEDLASRIGEDVTYRLREIIQGSSVHVRNNSERILKSTDVAKVLPSCSEMQICGYLSGGSSDFMYISDANVFLNLGDSSSVSLSCLSLSNESLMEESDLCVSGMWHLADDSGQGAPIIGVSSASTSDTPSSSIAPYLSSYFSTIAKVILCKHGKTLHCVLQDMRTNPNIALVVPYFINLLIEGLQELPKGSDACEHLLIMLHALTLNSNFYRDASVVISGLITSLLTYSVYPTPFEMTSLWRDLELREIAAEGISKVLQYWYGSDESIVQNIIEKMKLILYNSSSSLRSHYGSLVVLCCLDSSALFHGLWFHFEEYFEILNNYPSNHERLVLEGCILRASGILYRSVFNAAQNNFKNVMVGIERLAKLDRILYSHFGDALCAQWKFSLCATPVNKAAHWSQCSSQHFLDLFSQEKCRRTNSNLRATAMRTKVPDKNKRGCESVSEVFEFVSLINRSEIIINPIRGCACKMKLTKKTFSEHIQYTEPSKYYIKSIRMKPIGRMSYSHLRTSHLNLSGVLSTSL